MKGFFKSQRGFTLIELLIVVAVLGALVAVVVPAVGSFLTTAELTAANTESANVETAALAYLTAKGAFPETSAILVIEEFLSAEPRAIYSFSLDYGGISEATLVGVTNPWSGIKWEQNPKHQWVKKTD